VQDERRAELKVNSHIPAVAVAATGAVRMVDEGCSDGNGKGESR